MLAPLTGEPRVQAADLAADRTGEERQLHFQQPLPSALFTPPGRRPGTVGGLRLDAVPAGTHLLRLQAGSIPGRVQHRHPARPRDGP